MRKEKLMPAPYPVSKLVEGLSILASYFPNLWVKPVISPYKNYGILETAAIPRDAVRKMPQVKREELKRLGWACDEFRQKFYWYLVVPDDHRIFTFDLDEHEERMLKLKIEYEANEKIRESNRRKAEKKQL